MGAPLDRIPRPVNAWCWFSAESLCAQVGIHALFAIDGNRPIHVARQRVLISMRANSGRCECPSGGWRAPGAADRRPPAQLRQGNCQRIQHGGFARAIDADKHRGGRVKPRQPADATEIAQTNWIKTSARLFEKITPAMIREVCALHPVNPAYNLVSTCGGGGRRATV